MLPFILSCLTPASSLLLLFAAFPLVLLVFRQVRSPNKTPTPQSYPIIGNLIGVLCNYHRFYDWVVDLATEAGGLTFQVNGFLGLSHILLTVDPANIHHLLKANFQNYVKGSRFRDNLHEFLGDGIFNVDGHLWSVQRKIASHEFKTSSLKSFISRTVHCEIYDRLLPFFTDACDKDEIVDLQAVLQKFVFDNICNLAFDFDPACLDETIFSEVSPTPAKARASSLFKCFDDATEICVSRVISPLPIIWKIKRFFCIGSSVEIHDVKRRIGFQYPGGEEEILQRYNRELHPSRKRHDVDRADLVLLATLRPSSLRTPHLHAALTESMRLFPPVPMNTRLVVNDDILPDGSQIRSGWSADISAYTIARMEKIWGSDCREFKPDRWLDGEGNFQPSEHYKYLVFHGGPRICLGKDMAYVQMKAVAVVVLCHFEVVVVDGGATPEKMRNPPYKLGINLKMRDGLPVKLRRRN